MIGRICCLTLPLLFGAVQDDLPPNWKAVVSKEGGFSVSMPGAPKEEKQKVATATGQLNVSLVIAEGRLDSLFVVSWTDFSEAELKKGAVEKRLDHARDGAVSSARGKLRSEKPAELSGHPGREVIIEKDGEVIAKMRIYLIKNRLYQVMVLGTGPIFAAKEKDVGTFLDSFRLNK